MADLSKDVCLENYTSISFMQQIINEKCQLQII